MSSRLIKLDDDALQIARASDFDVALLDINLGGKGVDSWRKR
jgi:DNA-binding response OmpR family regulator